MRGEFKKEGGFGDNVDKLNLQYVNICQNKIVFPQGVEAVKKSVKESWDAGIFTVFLIVDKQDRKDSILDIRTPGTCQNLLEPSRTF